MPYRHDLFISYRRDPETAHWIHDHFIPLLRLRVGMDLGRQPSIYLDEQTEAGRSWPLDIGSALGASRAMILLWTKTYLASRWCTIELSHMLARERAAGLRTIAHPNGLIIPAVIHDGSDDEIPLALRHIKRFEIQNSFNVRMARTSPRAEELDATLTKQSPAIASAIRNAPAWRDDWISDAADEFFAQFYQDEEPAQTDVPRFAA